MIASAAAEGFWHTCQHCRPSPVWIRLPSCRAQPPGCVSHQHAKSAARPCSCNRMAPLDPCRARLTAAGPPCRPYHVLEALGPLSARTLTTLQQGVMLCDAGQPGWPVVYVSTQWCRLLGLPPHTAVGRRLWDVFEVPGAAVTPPWGQSALSLCRMRTRLQSLHTHARTTGWQAQEGGMRFESRQPREFAVSHIAGLARVTGKPCA